MIGRLLVADYRPTDNQPVPYQCISTSISQSINQFISCHSTEARAIVRLCQINTENSKTSRVAKTAAILTGAINANPILWQCRMSVHNTTQNNSDNLPSYHQTAQMLSIGGEGRGGGVGLQRLSSFLLSYRRAMDDWYITATSQLTVILTWSLSNKKQSQYILTVSNAVSWH